MKKILVVLWLMAMSGCTITKEEFDQASIICEADGSQVSAVGVEGLSVVCENGNTFNVNTENLYNAMLVLGKKGE